MANLKVIRAGLIRLAADLEEKSYAKLAKATIKMADDLVAPGTPKNVPVADPVEELAEGSEETSSEELPQEAAGEGESEDVEEVTTAEGEDPNTDEDGEAQGCGEDCDDDDVEALADDLTDGDDADSLTDEATPVTEAGVQENIAMREACTRLYRIASDAKGHPNPVVRKLGRRMLKLERYIRATL